MLQDCTAFSGFSVNDMAAAQKFYGDTLGITVSSGEMGLELQFKDGLKVFVYDKADHVPAVYTVLNFVVPNIDEAVDEMTAKGVVFERYANMPAQQDEKGILRGLAANYGPDITWFKDPAGNILGLLQNA